MTGRVWVAPVGLELFFVERSGDFLGELANAKKAEERRRAGGREEVSWIGPYRLTKVGAHPISSTEMCQ